MSKWQTYFNKSWLSMTDYTHWLAEAPSAKDARCRLCQRNFGLGNMGIAALRKHANGQKHKTLLQSVSNSSNIMQQFCKPAATPAVTIASASSDATSSSCAAVSVTSDVASSSLPTPGVIPFHSRQNATSAEVMVCLHAIKFGNSLRSVEDMVDVCKMVFPDSTIAQEMQMKKDKVRYTIIYGIAPYAVQKLLDNVEKCKWYVLLYDESLNRVAQRGQMDIHIRFWNGDRVTTRYLTSAFLGHATSTELRKGLESAMQENHLDSAKMLQVGI